MIYYNNNNHRSKTKNLINSILKVRGKEVQDIRGLCWQYEVLVHESPIVLYTSTHHLLLKRKRNPIKNKISNPQQRIEKKKKQLISM